MALSTPAFGADYPRYGSTPEEDRTLKDLWQNAQQLSGITSQYGQEGYKRYSVHVVTKEQFTQEICPDNPESCKNNVAATRLEKAEILLRSDIKPEKYADSRAVVLHEFVHVLQRETMSADDMVKNCKSVEQQAYDAQNDYLAAENSTIMASVRHACR